MSAQTQKIEPGGRKVRWFILSAAVAFFGLVCVGAVVAFLFYRSNVTIAVAAMTVLGVSIEVLFWTAAGVFGWSFLAKRRERWDRLFRKKPEA